MKFSDFICNDAVSASLAAEDKQSAIEEIVKALVTSGKVAEDDHDSIVSAVMKREELGSTGIGRGVAVPHTKHPSVDRLVGAVAISEEGDSRMQELADDVIEIPSVSEFLQPIVAVVPLQLLAYHVAVLRGCDVDKPRNLAKSVTVE